MNPLPDWLRPLEFTTQPFPREAVLSAVARREDSTPHLLRALEWAEAHPDEANNSRPPYMLHLFALYLLAQFREVQALPLVLRLFRNPEYESLTGDVATESLSSILASVCGGDATEIQALIEDRTADEWVRAAGVKALGALINTEAISRKEASTYFTKLFHRGIERKPNHAWDCLISVCTDFRMIEHLDSIRGLYHQGLADPFFERLQRVESEIAKPARDHIAHRRSEYALIDDTVAKMSHWHCFKPGSQADDGPDDLEVQDLPKAYAGFGAKPIVRDQPKIGRNDLCPCGSGKKYKKCCGR
jgi:hypothetical protein